LKRINYLLGVLSLIVWLYFFSSYGVHNEIFGGDSLGYYSYLPSTFIYNNLTHMETSGNDRVIPDRIKDYMLNGPYNNPKTPLDKYLVQYTIGIALMELPFFLIAHLQSTLMDSNQDGFGNVYCQWIKISNIVYFLLGFWLAFLSLRRFYNSDLARFVCFIIFLGSNMLFFTSYHFGMSHVPLFFLYALVIYWSLAFHEHPTFKKSILIGLAIGLVILIRATDIIILLIPLLYDVYDKKSLIEKWQFIKCQRWKLLVGILIAFLPIVPQLIYWKIMSGSYFYYSYGSQKLDLSNPHILDGWFGSDNGWLHYSPMMLLSVFGLIMYKMNKKWALASIIIIFGYSYLIYSWFCYQYVNGFGSRPMINIYAILAFPMAACIQYVLSKKAVFKFGLSLFIIATIYINLAFTYKQLNGQLWSEYSSLAFNASTLFKSKLDKLDLVTMDIPYIQPRDHTNFSKRTIVSNSFESDSIVFFDSLSSSKVFYLSDLEYSPVLLHHVLKKKELENLRHIKISGKFLLKNSPYYYYKMSELSFNVKRNGISIFNKACKIDNKLRNGLGDTIPINVFEVKLNQWSAIEYFIPYPIHKDLYEGDVFEVYINNQAKSKILVDDVSLSFIYK
jgi:hypothetical protein